jgi:hypothetical protein
MFRRVAERAKLGVNRRVDVRAKRVQKRDDVGIVRRLEIIRALGTGLQAGPAAECGQERQRDYNCSRTNCVRDSNRWAWELPPLIACVRLG